jgi:hypothetical protein
MTTTEKRPIDWLAVTWVCEGKALPLSAAEKRVVVRQMSDQVICNGGSGEYPPPGKLFLRQLAERLGMSVRSIDRIRAGLPRATKRLCPHCKGSAWVLDSGAVEEHCDGFYFPCSLTVWPDA